ncbi:hypothetical protein QFC19_001713 [Naganishia cerealis]|uniref:Uncharacterized protein n=1 Tax=Naganishia cerealis TaxID=610337 RepID=A0ACC2WGN2_9TREE|nr:hypothetical protein QFC19_001713 [Naganishia cerealis]
MVTLRCIDVTFDRDRLANVSVSSGSIIAACAKENASNLNISRSQNHTVGVHGPDAVRAENMPRLPPLRVSFEPVPIETSRRIYIQNLVNLLHHAIRTDDQPRASLAWGILIRCEEVDWRTSWKWALPVFDLEVDAARRMVATGSGQGYNVEEPYEVLDIWRRKETYLRRLLVSVALMHASTRSYPARISSVLISAALQRPEILLTLVLHLIEAKEYQRALDDLELYLISYPYILSATLHSYAGLLCFYLSQPAATREFSCDLATVDDRSRESSSSVEDDSDNAIDSYRPRNGSITAEALHMDERMLRNASIHFSKALETEKDAQGLEHSQEGDHGSLQPIMKAQTWETVAPKHGTAKVAKSFLDKIDSLLREHASDEEDDFEAEHRNLSSTIPQFNRQESVNYDEQVPQRLEEKHRDEAVISPPETPSTVANELAHSDAEEPAQDLTLTRIRSTNDSRRDLFIHDDLSDGSGSVYSEMSIG